MIALRPLAPWLDVVARNPRCPRHKREVGGTDASRGARRRIKGCEPFTLVRRSMLRPLKRVHEFRDPIHEFIRLGARSFSAGYCRQRHSPCRCLSPPWPRFLRRCRLAGREQRRRTGPWHRLRRVGIGASQPEGARAAAAARRMAAEPGQSKIHDVENTAALIGFAVNA